MADAQQREGEYSPSKRSPSGRQPALNAAAQQREGEYSPSKQLLGQSLGQSLGARSTKGGGILPLQVPHGQALSSVGSGAQQREGEYSPSKSPTAPTRPAAAPAAQQREGEYSPSK